MKRRLALAGGAVAVAAVALTAGLPLVDGGDVSTGGTGPTAAFAVTRNDDRTVTVEIKALRDAEGLERALRAAGIPALVQYLPPGKACKEPTVRITRPGSGRDAIESSEDGAIRFVIDTIALQPGQTLVIQTRDLAPRQAGGLARQPASSRGFSIAEGGLEPCELVNAADVPPPGGRGMTRRVRGRASLAGL